MEGHCRLLATDDLAPWRALHLEGMEVLPEQTFPAQHDHDAPLAAKLVAFFHAEQRHVGRPMKARKIDDHIIDFIMISSYVHHNFIIISINFMIFIISF